MTVRREAYTPAIRACKLYTHSDAKPTERRYTAVPAERLWCLQTNDPEKRAKTARRVTSPRAPCTDHRNKSITSEPVRVLPARSGTNAPGRADEQTTVINNFSNPKYRRLSTDNIWTPRTVRGFAACSGQNDFFNSLLFFFYVTHKLIIWKYVSKQTEK